MVTLNSIFNAALLERGISKKQFIEKVGYLNTNKGIRRLVYFLETGKLQEDRIFEGMIGLLKIAPPVLQKAIQNTQKLLLIENLRNNKKNFRPYIEVELDRIPRPIFVAALAPGLWHIDVPEEIQRLEDAEELGEVVRLFKKHFDKHKGNLPGTQAIFEGFRYHRSVKETLIFDKNGEIIKRLSAHNPKARASIRLE